MDWFWILIVLVVFLIEANKKKAKDNSPQKDFDEGDEAWMEENWPDEEEKTAMPRQATQPTQTKSKSFFDDILEQIQKGEAELQKQIQESNTPKEQCQKTKSDVKSAPVPAVERVQETAQTSSANGGRVSHSQHLSHKNKTQPTKQHQSGIPFPETDEEFDLKRAVIYAEILKPKFEEE